MHPNTYLNLYPAFPRDARVFVAMSFDKAFDKRWKDVIQPAVENTQLEDGTRLTAHRVDMRTVSDSILTEILEGIARCRVFLADISVVGELGGRPVRNANVMYEVGLAPAARLPEEVILVRSDHDELLFDVMNIRVLRYDPDNDPGAARSVISSAILDSQKELDLRKAMAVRRIAETIDYGSFRVLLEAIDGTKIHDSPLRTMGDVLSLYPRNVAIRSLLDRGLLQADMTDFSPDFVASMADEPEEKLIHYRVTPLGIAVFDRLMRKMNVRAPSTRGTVDSPTDSQSD